MQRILIIAVTVSLMALTGVAQTRHPAWRGAGPTPCVGADGGVMQCPPAPAVVAIRAGKMFDSVAGLMLTNQVIVISGERIAETGPAARIRIPAGAQIIDLSGATVLPGLIDAHTHMFNTRQPGGTTEASVLIAVQNAQADLRAGFTTARDMSNHGNGYADVAMRDAIEQGRIEGPRYRIATRGIVWSATPPEPSAPDDPLKSAAVRSAEEGRAAVRDQVAHGADWIKLYPSGPYTFNEKGEAQYPATYPLPVLQALIDETHRAGRKAGCHVFGGEGLDNSIVAGCDTIEHAFGLAPRQAATMAQKGIAYDPTLVRYTEPYMDDNDAKSTGGKFRMIPIFEKAVRMAAASSGLKIMFGSGVDGSMYAHGTQGLDFEALVKHGGLTPARALQGATSVNAEVLGWQDRVGSIAKGMYADIVAVAGNPLTDISEMQRVKFVMKGGRVFRNEIVRKP